MFSYSLIPGHKCLKVLLRNGLTISDEYSRICLFILIVHLYHILNPVPPDALAWIVASSR